MIVEYLREVGSKSASMEIQQKIIDRYCKRNHINCEISFRDTEKIKRGEARTRTIQLLGFTDAYRSERTYPAFERMLKLIVDGQVSGVVVDMKSRLFTYAALDTFFQKICKEKQVKIIEAIDDEPDEVVDKKKVAIYLVTNKSDQRPIIYERELDKVYEFASQQKCWDVPYVYLDKTLKKSEHSAYERFKEQVNKFDILLLLDFYQLEDKLGTFLKEVLELNKQGIQVISMRQGAIRILPEEIIHQKRKVVAYDNGTPEMEKDLKKAILQAFVNHRTQWQLETIYMEEMHTEDWEEIGERLVEDSEKWILLVRKFNCLHPRTIVFFRMIKAIGIPIYSLEEGGICFEDI